MTSAEFGGASSSDVDSFCPNDTRYLSEPAVGLYAVVDARGPTYGGWYRPVGVEQSWRALVTRVAQGSGSLLEAVQAGLMDANSAALAAAADGQDQAKRRHDRKSGGDLSHPTLSIALVALRGDVGVAAGVGSCRIYLRRSQHWALLIPGQTLAVANPDRQLPENLRHAPRQVLGFGPSVTPDLWSGTPESADAFFLCTAAVWTARHTKIIRHSADVSELLSVVNDCGGNASACVVGV